MRNEVGTGLPYINVFSVISKDDMVSLKLLLTRYGSFFNTQSIYNYHRSKQHHRRPT